MARSIDARVARLEVDMQRRQRRHLTATAAQYGVTVDDLLDEARRMLALPLVEQLAEIDEQADLFRANGLTDADLQHIKQTLTAYYRPMD